jgi:molybdate transport system ATP-binding protein
MGSAGLRSDAAGQGRVVGIEVWLRDLDLHRGGRPVLRALDWRLRPGQRWVLVGVNGSGKTQLLKLIAGAVWPDPPAARRLRATTARRYRLHGGAAGQTGGWLDQPLEVADSIAYLGPERQERYDRYGWNFPVDAIVATAYTRSDIPERPPTRAERRRVAALLREFGIERLARRPFLTLSYGQRRIVLLARALAGAPRLLLLDELFGGLDPGHRERLQRWFEGPGARLSWVLATHRPDEVPASATHCARLVQGQLHRSRRTAAPRPRPKPQSAGGAPRRPRAASAADAAPGTSARARSVETPLVAFDRVSIFIDWHPVLRDIDLTIGSGQCWVVHGPNGAGKTTLLRAIWGDWPAALGGQIRRLGIGPGVALEDFQRHSGFVAPHQHSLQPPSITALEVVVSGLRGSFGLAGPATPYERRRACQQLEALGLGDRADDVFAALSWGTARRVLLARATVHRPRLLLLDEPCAGLDSAARRRLRDDIDALLARGLTVVMSAHHRDEWPQGTTHELVLLDGRAIHAGPRRS